MMLLGFELFLDCDIKLPNINERNIDWVLTDWADYMDPDAMTTLLGDAIFSIEEEEYWEACQHALEDPYERRMDDEDDEQGEAPSDDNEDSDSEDSDKEDSDSEDSDSGYSEDYNSKDNSNDREGAPCDENRDKEDKDAEAFNEENSYEGVGYYDEDIEDDEEVVGGYYGEYPYGHPSDWSCITDVIPELSSFHNTEFGSLTTYIDKQDDIDARLAVLDKILMIHSFQNLTLKSLEEDDEGMGWC